MIFFLIPFIAFTNCQDSNSQECYSEVLYNNTDLTSKCLKFKSTCEKESCDIHCIINPDSSCPHSCSSSECGQGILNCTSILHISNSSFLLESITNLSKPILLIALEKSSINLSPNSSKSQIDLNCLAPIYLELTSFYQNDPSMLSQSQKSQINIKNSLTSLLISTEVRLDSIDFVYNSSESEDWLNIYCNNETQMNNIDIEKLTFCKNIQEFKLIQVKSMGKVKIKVKFI